MQFHPPLISQLFTEQWHHIIQTFASKEFCTNAVFSMQSRMWIQKSVFFPWDQRLCEWPVWGSNLQPWCYQHHGLINWAHLRVHEEFCSFDKLQRLPFTKLTKLACFLSSCNFKKNTSGKSCWCSTLYKVTDVAYGNHLLMPSTDAKRKEQPPQ